MKVSNCKLAGWLPILVFLAFSQDSIFVSAQQNVSTFNEACLGVVSDLFSIDRDSLLCQTPTGMLYTISSVDDAWIKQKRLTGELVSGETILELPPNATLNIDTQTLELDEPPILHLLNPNERRLQEFSKSIGDKTVLAVRVVVSNSEVSVGEDQLSYSIFGGPNDLVNLKSQVYACSHGKLNFQKRPDLNGYSSRIRNGVVTININLPVEVGHSTIVNAVSEEINKQFGMTHMAIANHIMYCLPPGAYSGVGYAVMNRGLSVFNNNLCTSVSTQMHEIGHNLNLGHSAEGTDNYGDQSGMMGYSYRASESPKMCYNAAKSFQLGWFRDKTPSYTPGQQEWTNDRSFSVASIANYDSTSSDVAIELVQPALELNYYISFNAAIGFNSGVREGKNQVLVFQKAWIDGNESWRVAEMSDGQSFRISEFNGVVGDTLTITAVSIDLSRSEALVRVRLNRAQEPTPFPTRHPTPPPTIRPTPFPTRRPTQHPTPRPSRGVGGRNPTKDDSPATGQSCKNAYDECGTTTDCCAGYSCRRVSSPSGFTNVCRAIAKNSKDKLPRTTLQWWNRRLRGDSSATHLSDPDDDRSLLTKSLYKLG